MSQILDSLKAIEPLELGGTGAKFIDADTLTKGDKKYRIQGIDAAEVEKWTGKEYKPGTAGGEATTGILHKLANDGKFTNITPLLDENGEPQEDKYGRILTDLTNDAGKSFKTSLLEADAFDVNTFTSQSDIAARDIAEARRNQAKLAGTYTPDAFDIAAAEINKAEAEEGAKQVGFRIDAVNEAERQSLVEAGYEHLVSGNVQNRHADRTLGNVSRSQFSDSWDIGVNGAKEGYFGMLNLLGETYDNEWLAELGEDGITRMQARSAQYATTLTDYKDIDGWKDFAGMGHFLANNMAMSLPYMGITVGGAAAGVGLTAITGGGALVAVAAGTIPAASVYAGQTWNEMEGEKSAGVAVASGIIQASLDRLGLAAVGAKLGPKKAFEEGVKAIMKRDGVSAAAAKKTLTAATEVDMRDMLKHANRAAQSQLDGKALYKNLRKAANSGAGRTIGSGLGEAVTEMGQETTAYLAAVHGSDKTFDWNELNQRLIASAIAGGTLGSALSVPFNIKKSIQRADYRVGQEIAEDNTASQSQIYANEEKAERGHVPSIDENLLELQQAPEGFKQLGERASKHNSKHKAKSFVEKLTEAALNPSALWVGATRNIFTPDLQSRSVAARKMADMFGGNLQRIYSGANFESDKFHRVAVYKNLVTNPVTLFSNMGRGKRATAELKKTVSKKIYAAINSGLDKDGNFDPNSIPDSDPDKIHIIEMAKSMDVMADKMWKDQAKYNPKLGFVKNYLAKYKSLDKRGVEKNRKGFENLLMKKHKYSKADAVNLVDEILNNSEVQDIDDAFSVIKGGNRPTAHKKRTLGLSEDPDFQEFMQQDIFANLAQAAKSAAKYGAHQKFIGDNGSVVSKLLDQMEAEGVPEAEVDKVASQMQNYLDAESGNYKRPTSKAGKKAAKLQKNLMMLMTLSGLPLATISSFVELMLVNRGLTSEQVWGKKGSMKAIGAEFVQTIKGGMGEIASSVTKKDFTHSDPKSLARDKLQELGFYDWDVGAATVTGVTEVNEMQQYIYESFFQWTGLTGWTNYTRAARASIGLDYMNENADIVWKHKMGKGEYTREVQQAEEKLRNLGVDVDRYAEIQTKKTAGLELNEEETAFMADAVREGTFNFVNEAIALPQSANRPLIYQDPRFALFTQFQGFIATFTANHIPKLWHEYVKRGTPAMKYNAFATAATMIMMGFVSMGIKDLIKYMDDEDEFDGFKTGKNPYLETGDYWRRGVQASGLLGTAERPLNFLSPIYDSASDGPVDWLFNSVVGESPALGWGQRAGNAAGHFLKGDTGKAVEQALKASPGVGPLSWINRKAGNFAGKHWNFNGEGDN